MCPAVGVKLGLGGGVLVGFGSERSRLVGVLHVVREVRDENTSLSQGQGRP